MAVTTHWYGNAFVSAFNKLIDFDTDVIKVMLTTSAYTPNQDLHQFKSSVTNEIFGTGYTAGGQVLGGPTLTYTGSTNTLAFTGNAVSWPNSTLTARRAVIYDATPALDADRPLLAYVDFGADVSSSNGNFQLTWDTAGIVTITVA